MTASDMQLRPTHPLRIGPRPLPLHLGLAAMALSAALNVSSGSKKGWDAWKRDAAARRLAAELENADQDALADAVRTEARARLEGFMEGLTSYQTNPFRRGEPKAHTMWRRGSMRVLDYGPAAGDPAVLLIPSLVNRYYVMDLLPGRSFAEYLVGCGVRTFVVDWGDLGGEERLFDLGDFVAQRLDPALRFVAEKAPRLVLVGYCMGGNLALALALRRWPAIAGLALLATPWDFHAERPEQAKALAAIGEASLPAFAAHGAMPVDALQALFAFLDPLLAYRKLRRFAKLDKHSEEAAVFVALEDWLNDGVPLPVRVARECLVGWYGENQPARSRWEIAGSVVRPETFTKPSLTVVPATDRIVAPGSARALAAVLPATKVLRASAGHIGMMAGGRARRELWEPVAEWLRKTAKRSSHRGPP